MATPTGAGGSGIAVVIGGDTQPLNRALADANRNVRQFGDRAERDLDSFGKRFSAALGGPARAVAIAMGVAQSAIVTMTVSMASATRELEIVSEAIGSNIQELQRWHFAAETVNIEHAAMSSALQNVTKSVGEFLSTGGGPMQEFFKKIASQVGVTAEEFRGLSGPDALQLFYNTLERANLSQTETVAQLEKLSGGLSRMAPLLADNGRGLREIGDAAQRMGRVMSETDTKKMLDLANATDALKEEVSGLTTVVLTGLAPAITTALEQMTGGAAAAREFAQGVRAIADRSDVALPSVGALSKEFLLRAIPGGRVFAAVAGEVADNVREVGRESVDAAIALQERTAAEASAQERLNALLEEQRRKREILDKLAAGEYVAGYSDPNQFFGEIEGDVFDSELEEYEKRMAELEEWREHLGSDPFGTSGAAEGENAFEAYDPASFFPLLDPDNDMFETSLERWKEYLDNVYGYAEYTGNAVNSMMGDRFGDTAGKVAAAGQMMVEGFSQKSRKMFEISKTWAYADAFVNTAKGVMAALGQQDYAGAAFIAAAGAVQIAKINAMKFQGGSGGGVSSAGTTRPAANGTATPVDAEPVRTLRIEGIREDSRYSGGQVEGLARELEQFWNDGGGRGRIIFANQDR